MNSGIPYQHLFDTVVDHLLTQAKKSLNASRHCLYKGPDGLQCAIGVLIDDKYYASVLEGEEVDDPSVLRAVCLSQHIDVSVPQSDNHFDLVGFLKDLQYTHDESHAYEWERELKKHAASYGLEWNYKGQPQ
jgi:hypothetical protein